MEQTIDIQELVQDQHNFNKGTAEGEKLMQKSLTELGAGRSILIDKDGNIIAGNKTQKAAIAAGIQKVRVIESDGSELIAVKRTDLSIDSKKGRELALADNVTTQVNLAWDAVELDTVAAQEGIDLPDWGLDPKDLGIAQEQEPQEAQEDDFDEEKDPVATICQEGDVWQLGEHRLMCGDSTKAEDVARLMDGELATMFITDPPYGVSYTDKNEFLNSIDASQRLTNAIQNDSHKPEEMEKFWVAAFTIGYNFTKERMSYYITAPQGGDLLLLLLQAIRTSGFALKHSMVWNKNNHVLGRCDYNYKHEPIIYGWKQKGTHDFYGKGKFKTNVWDIPKPLKNDLHPTMKPVALIENMLLNNSIEGDIALDLFGGSGTTLIACEQLHRKARLMELDPHYCDVIIARWEKLTGQKAIKL